MPSGMEVDLGPGHIVLDGDPAYPPKGHSSHPFFGPCLLWPNGRPSQFQRTDAATGSERRPTVGRQKVPILYSGRLFPQKLPLIMGDLDPYLILDPLALAQSESIIQTAL